MLHASLAARVFLLALIMNPPADPSQPITKTRALAIARKALSQQPGHQDFVILEDKTIERPFGWVFFYNSRQYLQTSDPSHQLLGNGPLVVNRADGSTEALTTSMPPERAIQIYEEHWLEKHPKK
jgi:hypothetical protein